MFVSVNVVGGMNFISAQCKRRSSDVTIGLQFGATTESVVAPEGLTNTSNYYLLHTQKRG